MPKFLEDHRGVVLAVVDGLGGWEYRKEVGNIGNVVEAENFFDGGIGDFVGITKGKRVREWEREAIERGMGVLGDMKRIHRFTMVKVEGVQEFKMAQAFQDEIVNRGLIEGGDFWTKDNFEVRLNGMVDTDDEKMKEKLKNMDYNEILVLRGDRSGSLGGGEAGYNDAFLNQHLSWFLKLFPKELQDLKSNERKYLKFFWLFLLYNKEDENYDIIDSVVRVFAF
jgi:hypothetical protein